MIYLFLHSITRSITCIPSPIPYQARFTRLQELVQVYMGESTKPVSNDENGGRTLTTSVAWSLSTLLQVVRSSQSLDVGVGVRVGVPVSSASSSSRGYPQHQFQQQTTSSSSSSSSSFAYQNTRTEAGTRTNHSIETTTAPSEMISTNSNVNDTTTTMLRHQRHLDTTASPDITAVSASLSLSSSLSECLNQLLLLGRSQPSNTARITTTTATVPVDGINSPLRQQQQLPTLQFTLTSRQTLALYSSFISTASIYVNELATSSGTNNTSESTIVVDSTSLRGAIMIAWDGVVRMLGGMGTTVLSSLLYV